MRRSVIDKTSSVSGDLRPPGRAGDNAAILHRDDGDHHQSVNGNGGAGKDAENYSRASAPRRHLGSDYRTRWPPRHLMTSLIAHV
ncbi:unnamed protein product, partial [Iphiclides podalirius]